MPPSQSIDTSICAPHDRRCHRQRSRRGLGRCRHLASLPARQISVAMTTLADEPAEREDAPFSLLLRLLELPDGFFETEVLRRLGPRALASLAGAGRGFAAAVAVTALMQWARDEKKLLRPRRSALWPDLRLCWREACSLAALGGRLEVLKRLRSTGCPCDSVTCRAAAEGGHLEALKWLHNTGCPWDSVSCYAAAAAGRLEVLKWLHSAGCPWDRWTCVGAARGGHLVVLKWAREHGYPWGRGGKQGCEWASNGHPETLAWVRAQPD